MKFYIYTSKSKEDFEFVEEDSLNVFAAHEYNPETMVFSGIVVEAEGFEQALQIYKNPACGFGEYMLTDEPSETVNKRCMGRLQSELQVACEDLNKRLEIANCMLKMKLAAMKLRDANELINQISETFYEIYDKPSHVSPQTIFDCLSRECVRHTISYNGKSKKSG